MSANFINAGIFPLAGDGVTDDSRALQDAINFAHQNHWDLFIPEGNYLLATSNYGNKSDGGKTAAALHIFSHMRVFGEENTVLIAGKGITHMIINDNGENDTDNKNAAGYNGGENITLEKLTFDGGRTLGNGKCTPINFSHGKNITVRDVTVKNVDGGWHCIEINSTLNARVTGCTLGENCECSEVIQLDAALNEGNLGANDMTAVNNVEIFDNHFYCNNCRALGSHSEIGEYNGVQNWAENIRFHNNIVKGSPDNVNENESPRHRPGYINFVYHTRNVEIFNNAFSSDGDEPAPIVYIQRNGNPEEEKRDETIKVYSNDISGNLR